MTIKHYAHLESFKMITGIVNLKQNTLFRNFNKMNFLVNTFEDIFYDVESMQHFERRNLMNRDEDNFMSRNMLSVIYKLHTDHHFIEHSTSSVFDLLAVVGGLGYALLVLSTYLT